MGHFLAMVFTGMIGDCHGVDYFSMLFFTMGGTIYNNYTLLLMPMTCSRNVSEGNACMMDKRQTLFGSRVTLHATD